MATSKLSKEILLPFTNQQGASFLAMSIAMTALIGAGIIYMQLDSQKSIDTINRGFDHVKTNKKLNDYLKERAILLRQNLADIPLLTDNNFKCRANPSFENPIDLIEVTEKEFEGISSTCQIHAAGHRNGLLIRAKESRKGYVVNKALFIPFYKVIGRVLHLSGKTTRENTKESLTKKNLSINSYVYQNDRLETGENGYLKIKLNDGSVVHLLENSVLLLNTYNYQELSVWNYQFELSKGTLKSYVPSGQHYTAPQVNILGNIINLLITGTEFIFHVRDFGVDKAAFVLVLEGTVSSTSEQGVPMFPLEEKRVFGFYRNPSSPKYTKYKVLSIEGSQTLEKKVSELYNSYGRLKSAVEDTLTVLENFSTANSWPDQILTAQ